MQLHNDSETCGMFVEQLFQTINVLMLIKGRKVLCKTISSMKSKIRMLDLNYTKERSDTILWWKKTSKEFITN